MLLWYISTNIHNVPYKHQNCYTDHQTLLQYNQFLQTATTRHFTILSGHVTFVTWLLPLFPNSPGHMTFSPGQLRTITAMQCFVIFLNILVMWPNSTQLHKIFIWIRITWLSPYRTIKGHVDWPSGSVSLRLTHNCVLPSNLRINNKIHLRTFYYRKICPKCSPTHFLSWLMHKLNC
jgi:hypothetical protein